MANLFSYSRIVLAVLLTYLITQDKIFLGLIVMISAAITDFLDGFVARKLNQVSEFGAILDPIADRFFIICLCIGLLIKFWQPLFLVAAIIILAREFLVALGFLWLKNKGVRLQVSRLGKISTAFVFIAFVVVFILPKLGIYLLFLAIGVYLISTLEYIKTAWRQIA